MSSAYIKHITENFRLCILRILLELSGHSANESVIEKITSRSFGFDADRDRLRTQLEWLASNGLIELSGECEGCMVAKLTRDGAKVAKGQMKASGVDTPSL
jgi:hypothetical protein